MRISSHNCFLDWLKGLAETILPFFLRYKILIIRDLGNLKIFIYFHISRSWLFYSYAFITDFGTESGGLWRMRLDGSELVSLVDSRIIHPLGELLQR